MMKKFLKKQREIIIVFVYAGIFAGLVQFIIFPLLASINNVKDQIQEESMKQEFVRQQLGDLPKFQQQYDALEKNVNMVDVLLDKSRAVVLIEGLEKIAQDSNNKISISIVQDAPAQKNIAVSAKATVSNTLVGVLPSPDYLQMTIKLDGSYNTIMNFIAALESSEYYSDIIGIKIKQKNISDRYGAEVGVMNPFVLSSKNDMQKSDTTAAGDLEASIDAVFYTKK